MKTLKIALFSALMVLGNSNYAQQVTNEKFGNTLNLGAGIGYYGYLGRPLPVLSLNYELDVARNFTLAPFTGIYSYRNDYYWGNPDLPGDDPSYHLYYYRETIIPIGVKGTYYFDQLFRANPHWDFYAAASAGYNIRTVAWDNGYQGERYAYGKVKPLYMDAHIGSEYHFNTTTGIFLDLSSGVSTFGIAVHF